MDRLMGLLNPPNLLVCRGGGAREGVECAQRMEEPLETLQVTGNVA